MELAALKSEICAAAREGRAIQEKIRATRAEERHALWNQKRALGRRTRYLLLAYGYGRGVPYRRIEPRCRRDNDPRWFTLADVLLDREPPPRKEVEAVRRPAGGRASLAERWRRFVRSVTSVQTVTIAVPEPTNRCSLRQPFQVPLEVWLGTAK